MSKTTENTKKLINFIGVKFQNGELENDGLVQIIELANNFLNLTTISEYAKQVGKSYNGVKRFKKIDIEIGGVKFIVNND